MSRPALPEERGADLRPDPPTLDELRRAHDWRTEHRDRYEEGDRAFPVDVCQQCGHERPAARAGRPPDCEVREVPSRLVSVAKRHGLLPETSGVSHSHEIAGLWARSLSSSKAVGGEGAACAYCDVSLAGARCLARRVSTGFGAANVEDEAFCDRRCRGRYDERGPKDASQRAGSAGKRPTHRNTLAPYGDDDEAGGLIGATTETSSPEVQA